MKQLQKAQLSLIQKNAFYKAFNVAYSIESERKATYEELREKAYQAEKEWQEAQRQENYFNQIIYEAKNGWNPSRGWKHVDTHRNDSPTKHSPSSIKEFYRLRLIQYEFECTISDDTTKKRDKWRVRLSACHKEMPLHMYQSGYSDNDYGAKTFGWIERYPVFVFKTEEEARKFMEAWQTEVIDLMKETMVLETMYCEKAIEGLKEWEGK